MSIIEVDGLTRVYDTKTGQVLANDNLTFDVQEGEILGILGHNGAGKTTLMMQLMGLLVPTEGTIHMNGVDVVHSPEQVKPLVGFLPQKSLPLRFLELHKALFFTGRLRGMTVADAKSQVDFLIDSLVLSDYKKKYVNQLSGGLLRLTNFAMALMAYPKVLILDEPTNDLDPQHRRQVWALIEQMNQEFNTTCLLVTHNLLEAERVVQRVIVLQHGQIIMQGTPGEVKQAVQTFVQVELWMKDAAPLPSNLMQSITADITQLRPGHYRMTLPRESAQQSIAAILQDVGLDQLDDFRIAPPSLEDVYHQLQEA